MKNTRNEILNNIESAGSDIVNSHKRYHTFTVDHNGYKGEFTVKYPSLLDRIRIGTLRAQYLDGVPIESLDILTDNISFMAATLQVVLVKKPDWFNLEVLYDYDILDYVHTEYVKWVNSFRDQIESSRNDGSSRTSRHEETLEDNEDVQSSN